MVGPLFTAPAICMLWYVQFFILAPCFAAYGFFTEGTSKLPVKIMVLPLCNMHALVFAPFHTCTSRTALQPMDFSHLVRFYSSSPPMTASANNDST